MGSFYFARRYSRNHCCFLFLQLLRCFSSLRSPTITSVTIFICRVSPFGYLRISAYLQLPVAFRSSSRPSSAPSAKASTIRSYFLNFAIQYYPLFKDLSKLLLVQNHFSVASFHEKLRSLKTKHIRLNSKLTIHSFLSISRLLPRKEVIHPHVPVGIPCYDLTPIICPTLDGSFLTVRPPASGVTNSRGLTGGVYKTRERIHRNLLTCDY